MKFVFVLFIANFCFSEKNQSLTFLNTQSNLNYFLIFENIKSNKTKLLPRTNEFLNNRPLDLFYNTSSFELTQFDTNFKLFSNVGMKNNLFRFIVEGNVIIKITPKIIVQNDFEFDNNGFHDDNFNGRLTKSAGDWTGYLQHSSVTYFDNWGHLLFGRTNLSFGDNFESILINANIPPYETIWFHYKKEKMHIDKALIFLDSLNGQNRSIVFSRYSYNKSNNFNIGFTELCLFSYKTIGSNELSYFLPSAVLFENEVNNDLNTNLFWMIDMKLKIKNQIFYIEFLIDDYSIDKLSPNKLGINLNFISIINENFFTKICYTRINKWVGNYYNPELRMVDNNILIGNSMGPDSDKLSLNIFFEFNNKIFFNYEFSKLRKGNSDINDWPDGIGASSNFGYSYQDFPTPPYKKYYKNFFNFNYFINENYIASINMYDFKKHIDFSIKVKFK